MRALRVLAFTLASVAMSAQAVTVGQAAPGFSLSTYDGGTFSLAQQRGKVTVLFFFGCT
jgi:peroxiredoxin